MIKRRRSMRGLASKLGPLPFIKKPEVYYDTILEYYSLDRNADDATHPTNTKPAFLGGWLD
jgi:hypothetical protein